MFFILFLFVVKTKAQFRVRNDALIQIGYDDYRALTFGNSAYGQYGMEYWADAGGFNFWKPWGNTTGPWGNYILFLRDDHNVAIGSSGSSFYKLYVSGKVWATEYVVGSDNSFKKNISTIDDSLNKILSLNGVTYDLDFSFDKYSNLSNNLQLNNLKEKTMEADRKVNINEKNRIGFIAQDVRKILPQIVREDENGKLGVSYIDLIPVLVEAIKEQQRIIDELRVEVENLKKKNE